MSVYVTPRPRLSRSRGRSAVCRLSVIVAALLLTGAEAIAGPVSVDPLDPAWLVKDGAPFFFCGAGDPEDFFHRGTLQADGTRVGDQDQIIQKISGTGANTIWVTAVRSHGGDGWPRENPFVDGDPALGLAPAVIDQWDAWIGALDAAGVVSFFVFYDDGTRVWDTGSTVGAAESTFVTTLVDRFENYDNLIWCVCEEYQEAFNQARVSALAALIKQADDVGHPVASHQHESSTFHFPNDPNIDVFAMHCGYDNTPASLHTKVLNAWDFNEGRFHVIMSESINHFTDRTLARQRSWAAAMGGATVMVHKMDIAGTPVEALEDHGRLAAFFQASDFAAMEPRDDLAVAETDYVFGSAEAGWIVYAAGLSGMLGLTLPAGAEGGFDLYWLDVESGATEDQPAVALAAGSHSWAKPSGFGPDVVLRLSPSSATSAGASVETETWGRLKGHWRVRGAE